MSLPQSRFLLALIAIALFLFAGEFSPIQAGGKKAVTKVKPSETEIAEETDTESEESEGESEGEESESESEEEEPESQKVTLTKAQINLAKNIGKMKPEEVAAKLDLYTQYIKNKGKCPLFSEIELDVLSALNTKKGVFKQTQKQTYANFGPGNSEPIDDEYSDLPKQKVENYNCFDLGFETKAIRSFTAFLKQVYQKAKEIKGNKKWSEILDNDRRPKNKDLAKLFDIFAKQMIMAAVLLDWGSSALSNMDIRDQYVKFKQSMPLTMSQGSLASLPLKYRKGLSL